MSTQSLVASLCGVPPMFYFFSPRLFVPILGVVPSNVLSCY